jgi:hypothetical protein
MRRWSSDEDHVLRDQVCLYCACINASSYRSTDISLASFNVPIDWNAVSDNLVDRSNKDCRKRWQKIDTRWNSGAWTKEEDKKLQEAVVQSGER